MQGLTDHMALLRTVNMFYETPEDVLAEVAALLEIEDITAGQTIFNKGDRGDCMYIVVEGKVRVHDGARTLNYLWPRDVFGDMALLDAEPRAASVTAEVETRLLRLEQRPFYQLMETRPEVARGVIQVLSQRLRARLSDMAQDFAYIQQMERLTAAAAALESGVYQPGAIDEVAARTDALGQLARVFQRMAAEVVAREERLRQQVQELRIEIDTVKKEREVKAITSSEYFQDLRQKVQRMRGGQGEEAEKEQP